MGVQPAAPVLRVLADRFQFIWKDQRRIRLPQQIDDRVAPHRRDLGFGEEIDSTAGPVPSAPPQRVLRCEHARSS